MKILIIVAFNLITINLVAQNSEFSLKNSHWTVKIKGLKNAEAKVNFKEDTVYFFYFVGSDQQAVFTFSQTRDTLIIIKASGNDLCPVSSKGIYTIEPLDNGKKFLLHIVSDECSDRINGLTANPFERVGDKQ